MSWIKMRRGLRHDTKVIAMARYLSLDRTFMNWWGDPVQHDCRESVTEIVTFQNVTRVTVAGLLDVWASLNETLGEDGIAPHMTLTDIDDIAEIPGLGEAMLSVSWVIEMEEGGLQFPNFCEYNSPRKNRTPAKTDAERAKAYRQRKKAQKSEAKQQAKDAPPCDTKRHDASRREEKRREDINSLRSFSASAPEELELIPREPTTDELDAALRFDPKGELSKLTRTSWKAIVDMCGMCNSGAEKFTPESLAEAYLAEATRRELRVFRSKAQENAPKLSASTLRSDLESFVKLAKGSPERNNLVLRSDAKPKANTMHAPCGWWREICADLYDGTKLHEFDEWIDLPLSARQGIWKEFLHPVHTQAVASRHA